MSRTGNIHLYLVVCLILIIASRFFTYEIKKDFPIFSFAPCDPTTESCFMSICEPDSECDQIPYKKIETLALNTENCLLENDCEVFSCENDPTCKSIECNVSNLEEGETCVNMEWE